MADRLSAPGPLPPAFQLAARRHFVDLTRMDVQQGSGLVHGDPDIVVIVVYPDCAQEFYA